MLSLLMNFAEQSLKQNSLKQATQEGDIWAATAQGHQLLHTFPQGTGSSKSSQHPEPPEQAAGRSRIEQRQFCWNLGEDTFAQLVLML